MAKQKPGTKTQLTPALQVKMRRWVIQGKKLEEIAELGGVKIGTLEQWKSHNYLGIRDKFRMWRLEQRLALAEGNIDEILRLPIDEKTIRPIADMSKFVAETLGKEFYSRKIEYENQGQNELVVIEKAIIQIANTNDGERKPILEGRVTTDQESSDDSIQRREGRSDNIDPPSTDSIRADIQKILTPD